MKNLSKLFLGYPDGKFSFPPYIVIPSNENININKSIKRVMYIKDLYDF